MPARTPRKIVARTPATPRKTFVGIAACGHARYVAQDPATYGPEITRGRSDLDDIDRMEIERDEYKSLVDDLRHFAATGQIKLVGDDELAKYTAEMTSCSCKAP